MSHVNDLVANAEHELVDKGKEFDQIADARIEVTKLNRKRAREYFTALLTLWDLYTVGSKRAKNLKRIAELRNKNEKTISRHLNAAKFARISGVLKEDAYNAAVEEANKAQKELEEPWDPIADGEFVTDKFIPDDTVMAIAWRVFHRPQLDPTGNLRRKLARMARQESQDCWKKRSIEAAIERKQSIFTMVSDKTLPESVLRSIAISILRETSDEHASTALEDFLQQSDTDSISIEFTGRVEMDRATLARSAVAADSGGHRTNKRRSKRKNRS